MWFSCFCSPGLLPVDLGRSPFWVSMKIFFCLPIKKKKKKVGRTPLNMKILKLWTMFCILCDLVAIYKMGMPF